jgi:hypothetical protein
MHRHHLVPGIVLLGICFILSILVSEFSIKKGFQSLISLFGTQVSISLPYVRAFDIVRTTFGTSGGVGTDNNHVVAVRVSVAPLSPRPICTAIDLSFVAVGYLGRLLSGI